MVSFEHVAYDFTRSSLACSSSEGSSSSIKLLALAEGGQKAVNWQDDDGFKCHTSSLGSQASRWEPEGKLDLPAPVTCLAFGPPNTMRSLAAGLEDGRLLIFEQAMSSGGALDTSPAASFHPTAAAVTSVQFAPAGLPALSATGGSRAVVLAASFADGFVRVYQGYFDTRALDQGSPSAAERQWWEVGSFCAAPGPIVPSSPGRVAALCVAWRPTPASSQRTAGRSEDPAPLLAVGTSDGADVWAFRPRANRWELSARLSQGAEVRSVDWAPNHGLPEDLIALGGARAPEASVWALSGEDDALQARQLCELSEGGGGPVWRVEFDLSSLQLAVSREDGAVQVYQPNLGGRWALVTVLRAGSGDAMR